MFLIVALCSCEFVEITEANAAAVIGGPRNALVKFVFPECVYCQKMAPDFAAAANSDPSALYGSVDCSEHYNICNQFKVTGFPTVLFFRRGSKAGVEYQGDRSASSFKNFVKLQLNSENGDKHARLPRRKQYSRSRRRRIIEQLDKMY